jgi:methyl-accepting chemotaxis protein
MLNRLLTVKVADVELAQKGRLLTGMLLTSIVLVLAYIILSSLFVGTLHVPIASALVIVFMLVFYLLARQGYVSLSGGGMIAALVGVLTLGSIQPEASGLSILLTPMLLAIPIVLAGVLTSWRWVIVVTVATSVDAAWLYLAGAPSLQTYRTQRPEDIVIFTLEAVILMIASGILGSLSSRQVAAALNTLRHQNEELLSANHTLAEQRRQADALGATIAALATQLSQVSARQIHGVSAQAQSISQVVSAVTQLHTTADQIAAMGQQVRDAANLTMANVQRGQEILLRSRDAVQRNRAQVQNVMQRMAALETVTGRITTFVDRIRELSEETHLLALNATIEAAGAGTVGRRFGVVATEVRSLATRANEVVDQIRLLIGELEQAGRVTLAATQDTSAVVQDVELSAAAVRDTQEQVVQAAQRTNELVQLISTATRQQTSATEQVTNTMQQIAAVSDATSHDTDALDQVIGDLLRTANLLNSTGRLAPLAPS